MRRILTFVGLGCGGLIVLVLLLGIVGAIVGGNQETASKSDEEKQEAEPQDKPGDKKGEEEAPPAKQQGSTEAVTVRVTGTPGIPFQGNYGKLDSSRSVDGVTPQEFEEELDTGFLSIDSISAVMQKVGEQGELTVQIVVDGEVVKEQSTTAPYGVVSLNYNPNESG